MINSSSNNFLWQTALNLPKELLVEVVSNLQPINLEPGEKLNELSDNFPGLFLIEQGLLRIIAMDNKKEPFTIKTYSKGEFVGAYQLLTGVKGQAMAASTKVKGSLLPLNKFLTLVEKEKQVLDSFLLVEVNELFSATSLCKELNQVEPRELLIWAQNECINSHKAFNLKSGNHSISDNSREWIVSSCNIKDTPPGTLLRSPCKLSVNGKIPARLIPLPKQWPPKIKSSDSSSLKDYLLNDDEINNHKQIQRREKKLQAEALEDWYGKSSNKNEYPNKQANGPIEEPLACFRMLSQYFDLPFRKEVLRRIVKEQLKLSKEETISISQLAAISELVGLRCSLLQPYSSNLLERLPCPSLTVINGHPIILWKQNSGKLLIGDPISGQRWVSSYELFERLDGSDINVLFLESTSISPKARFGWSWFLPAVLKHRFSLIQVVIASFFAQLLGLFNPLLIQQIIDAVITQGNLTSLNILGTLLIAMAISQAFVGSLRTYLFTDTTNRIDISLGSKIIHHLLRLPLNYFSKRPVGEVSSRIGELEKIRSFLTGTALTVILDSVFSVLYIAVMLLYSVRLTFLSLAVVPFFILLSLVISPIIRQHLRNQAIASAQVNSHLVETLSGMETVKGQGIELQSEWRWEKYYSEQIQHGFRKIIASTSANSISNLLQQVSGLIVIWAGAIIVLNGGMTLGQLIAFRILSGYVTGPLLRMASLWQNFQETIISLERLSDIVDNKEEIEIAGKNLPPLAPIKGNITYEGINFRFRSSGNLQLANINFEIHHGQFIGIVGNSGSGKSTLLKLLTRLFNPLEGTIRIDGYDISKVDLYSLRSQIGVVPQDSLLFDGSVQENISLTRPDATLEEVENAAKIACAHDFILSLPDGYSSSVGERGANLSGGQRQRIAIARMILKQPKLLILDEATSSLDLETEFKLTSGLAKSFKNKTVLYITHRLASLNKADKILVLHEGALVEQGNHNELMELKGRYYTLYRKQKVNI